MSAVEVEKDAAEAARGRTPDIAHERSASWPAAPAVRHTFNPFRRLVPDERLNEPRGGLARQVRNGMATSGAIRIATQVVQLGGQVALVRLLDPAEYGLAAIVAAFAGLALIFTDLGLGSAVVHKTPVTKDDLATAFWINTLSGTALTLLFFVLAFPIARFYGHPELIQLVSVSGLALTLSASTVQLAVLERSLRFATAATVDLVATVASVVVGIACASSGLGALSLSLMYVALAVARTLLNWAVVGGVPAGSFSRESARYIYRYGRGLVGSGTLSYFSGNVDNFIIARVTGLSALAVYSRAFNLMLLPISQVQQVMGRVLFPALSALQNDLERMRNALERALPLMVAIGAPLSLGIAAASPAIIEVLYGPKWAGVAPLLELLALIGPPYLTGASLGLGLQALGRTGVVFRRQAVTFVLTVTAVLIGIHWGPTGVATALVIRSYVALPLNYLPVARVVGLRTGRLGASILPSILAAALMATGVYLLRSTGNGWLTLLGQIGLGALAYPVLLRALSPRVFAQVLAAVRGR